LKKQAARLHEKVIDESGGVVTYPTRQLFAFPNKAFHQSSLKEDSAAA
jgi:hypothetical protein